MWRLAMVVNTEPRTCTSPRGGHQRRLRRGHARFQREPPVRFGPANHRVASQSILLGDADVAIGGGAENMSRAPFASLNMRWGPHG